MNTVTYEIPFSLDQPASAQQALLRLLQQRLNQPPAQTANAALEMIVRRALTVLIIDAYHARAHYVATFLSAAGYYPLVVNDALEAFTRFLQGDYVPFVVVLGQEKTPGRFFLLRLLQQMAQKYEWETPLIRLLAVQAEDVPQVAFPDPPAVRTASTTVPLPELGRKEPAAERNGAAKEKVSLTGQSLGRYQVESLLGSSRYSDVYLIYDRLREQKSALKAIQTDFAPVDVFEHTLEDATIFQQEAELLQDLRHPHILPVINHGKSYVSGSPFIYKTMPYCAERSLAQWLRNHSQGKKFDTRAMVALVAQLGSALVYVHDHQILYQNFKMSNVLVLNESTRLNALQVALADFPPQDRPFSARTADAFVFVAPERWNGVSLPASDQYGLAALAYELLTGRPPFQGTSERILKQMHQTMQVQPPTAFNPKLPVAINDVLLRALARHPEDRFSSVSHFIEMLQRSVA